MSRFAFFFVQFFVGVQANEYCHKNWMNAQFAEVEVVTRQFFSFKGVSGGGWRVHFRLALHNNISRMRWTYMFYCILFFRADFEIWAG